MNSFTNYLLNLKYNNNIGPCNQCNYLTDNHREISKIYNVRSIDFELKNKMQINDNNVYRNVLLQNNNNLSNIVNNINQLKI